MAISPYVRSLRAAVGTTRLLLPAVTGIVRDGTGGVLLVRQREGKFWSTPGGTIEPDETPADAVAREVWEETGLVVRPARLLAVYGGPHFVVIYPNGDETQYITTIFECAIESGALRADGYETIEAKFWTCDEALRLRLASWLQPLLPRLFDVATAGWFEPGTWRP